MSYFLEFNFRENWFIYYLSFEGSMISSAFVYESEIVDYLYNSCRDHNLDEYNTGTYLNDQLLQNDASIIKIPKIINVILKMLILMQEITFCLVRLKIT
mgnify:CR=1 FL=1